MLLRLSQIKIFIFKKQIAVLEEELDFISHQNFEASVKYVPYFLVYAILKHFSLHVSIKFIFLQLNKTINHLNCTSLDFYYLERLVWVICISHLIFTARWYLSSIFILYML